MCQSGTEMRRHELYKIQSCHRIVYVPSSIIWNEHLQKTFFPPSNWKTKQIKK